MPDNQIRKEISVRQAVESVRGPMTNAEIMQKFKLNPRRYADVLRQLFEKRLITEADLERRGIRFKVLKKEAKRVQVEQAALPTVAGRDGFPDTAEIAAMLTVKTPGEPSSSSAPAKEFPIE